MDASVPSPAWRPPYLSYRTLVWFLDHEIRSAPVPPRIDRSYLHGYAVTTQAQLLKILGLLGLVDLATGTVRPRLGTVTGKPDVRRDVMRQWARSFYREQLELADEHASSMALYASFTRHGITGATLRKAVAFFLALCGDVELACSPHFRPVPQNGALIQAQPVASLGSSDASIRHEEFTFGPAGGIAVWTDLDWSQLPQETVDRLQRLLRELGRLAGPPPAGNGDPAGTP
ncbi:hypothetical protein [Actinomadura napierensis]|uniref:Uncharacterized protein n=1 Tax=Actinomadura napierensis TaxID=267854 RepID=A0ABP5M1A3_9ACTN